MVQHIRQTNTALLSSSAILFQSTQPSEAGLQSLTTAFAVWVTCQIYLIHSQGQRLFPASNLTFRSWFCVTFWQQPSEVNAPSISPIPRLITATLLIILLCSSILSFLQVPPSLGFRCHPLLLSPMALGRTQFTLVGSGAFA